MLYHGTSFAGSPILDVMLPCRCQTTLLVDTFVSGHFLFMQIIVSFYEHNIGQFTKKPLKTFRCHDFMKNVESSDCNAVYVPHHGKALNPRQHGFVQYC